MRSSIIALFILVASPLLVLAAPSSFNGELLRRDPVGDKLGNLTQDNFADHVEGLSDDKAKDLASKLTHDEIRNLLANIKDAEKLKSLLNKLGLSN